MLDAADGEFCLSLCVHCLMRVRVGKDDDSAVGGAADSNIATTAATVLHHQIWQYHNYYGHNCLVAVRQ